MDATLAIQLEQTLALMVMVVGLVLLKIAMVMLKDWAQDRNERKRI